MNIKENDQVPNSEIFIMENGDPVKKEYTRIFKR